MFGPPRKAPGGDGNTRRSTTGYRLISNPTSIPSTATCSQRWRGRRSSANSEPTAHATIEGKMIPPPVNHPRAVTYTPRVAEGVTFRFGKSLECGELGRTKLRSIEEI